MRLKSFVLCSTAVAMIAGAPAYAQTAPAQTPPAQDGQTVPPTAPEQNPVPEPNIPDAPQGQGSGVPVSGAIEQPTASPGEDIIVTGLRRSIATSQAIKRDSDAIVDALVAEDIGKLPDITASASLARIAGVQVNRAAGEAAQVQVRGLPDISTTYNGREIFTAEGRFVQIQDFPAGQVAALEVYKSSTANLIEGGIGGQVNVRGRRPFDFQGFTVQGALNGVHLEQSQELMYNANLVISNRWDTGIGEIGVLLSGANAITNFLDSSREAAQFIEYGVPALEPDAPPGAYRRAIPEAGERVSPDVIRYPDSVAVFYGRARFERPSATAAVQWKPTPDLEIYADGLFQGFRGKGNNSFHNTPLFGGPGFINVALEPESNEVGSFTAINATPPRGFASSEDANTDTYQIAGGLVWTPERTRISADIAYTDSTFDLQVTNIDYFLGARPVVDVDFDVEGNTGGPAFNWRDVNSADSNNYFFRGLFDRDFVVSGKDWQGRIDGEYELELGPLQRLQFGLRFNDRDASYRNGERFTDNNGQCNPGNPNCITFESLRIPFSALPVDLTLTEPGFRFDDAQRMKVFVRPTRDSIRANDDALRRLVIGLNPSFGAEGPPPFDPTSAFDANEKSYTSYGQLKYEFDLGGITIDGLGGLRIVRTETTVNGTSRNETPPPPGSPAGTPNTITFTPVSQTITRDDYLPNVSARIRLQQDLQLRLAFTQTRTRPNFNQLNPSSLTSPIGGDLYQNINSGNPNLRPLQSNNYDVSLEYYFSPTGSATVAAFRRDVNGFISNVQITELNDPSDPSLGGRRFNRPENGGDGRLQGIEATFASFFDFDFLPEWARAFGLQANYTYNDATSELPGNTPPLPGDLSQTLPGQQRLAGVSKHQYNIVALYERPTFSARLAYNYRSSWVTGYRNPPNNPLTPGGDCCIEFDRPEIHEGLGVLDFSYSVTPIENITLAFDVANLLGTPRRFTNPYTADPDGPSFPLRRQYIERLYSFGVRFRF